MLNFGTPANCILLGPVHFGMRCTPRPHMLVISARATATWPILFYPPRVPPGTKYDPALVKTQLISRPIEGEYKLGASLGSPRPT